MPRKLLRWDPNSLLSSGLLTLLLLGYVALVYVVVVALGVLPFGDMPDAQHFGPPWWLNLLALALIAATFWPVTRRLRDAVNELVYAHHDDPYLLVSRVSQHLRAMTNPQLTLPTVAKAIASALKLPYVAIETDQADSPVRFAFGQSAARSATSHLPITYLDRPLGALVVSARGPNRMLSDGDVTLLREVAQQVGIALYAAQLAADLQASRERLVIAREEERRRIRNDLHDGLAPALASLQLQLGAMRTLIRQDATQAEAMANDLREDLRNATAEIRQLVYDLRPPMLDDLGLIGAIKSLRIQGSAFDLEVIAPEPMPKLSAAVEAAVYRIAREALHNVAKHAQATACQIIIAVADGHLTLTVADDGQSWPKELTAGVGLHSMKERAAELGGTFSIEAGGTGGARVVARFPIHV